VVFSFTSALCPGFAAGQSVEEFLGRVEPPILAEAEAEVLAGGACVTEGRGEILLGPHDGDGSLLYWREGAVLARDARTGEEVRRISWSGSPPVHAVTDAKGDLFFLVTIRSGQAVLIVRSSRGEPGFESETLIGWSDLRPLSVTAQGRVFCLEPGSGRSVNSRNCALPEEEAVSIQLEESVLSLASSAAGEVLMLTRNRLLSWDGRAGSKIRLLRRMDVVEPHIPVLIGDRIVLRDRAKSVVLDTKDGKVIAETAGLSSWIDGAGHPATELLALRCPDGRVLLVGPSNLEPLGELSQASNVLQVGCVLGGTVILGKTRTSTYAWSAQNGKVLGWKGHVGPVRTLLQDAAGSRWLSAGVDRAIVMGEQGKEPTVESRAFDIPWPDWTAARVSSDSELNRILCSGPENKVTVFQWVAGGIEQLERTPAGGSQRSVAMSPDGRWAVALRSDGRTLAIRAVGSADEGYDTVRPIADSGLGPGEKREEIELECPLVVDGRTQRLYASIEYSRLACVDLVSRRATCPAAEGLARITAIETSPTDGAIVVGRADGELAWLTAAPDFRCLKRRGLESVPQRVVADALGECLYVLLRSGAVIEVEAMTLGSRRTLIPSKFRVTALSRLDALGRMLAGDEGGVVFRVEPTRTTPFGTTTMEQDVPLLDDEDPAVAWPAMMRLASRGHQACADLMEGCVSRASADLIAEAIGRLLAAQPKELDERFRQLLDLGPDAEAEIRKRCLDPGTVSERLLWAVGELDGPTVRSAWQRRARRTLEVLAREGSAEARKTLAIVAESFPSLALRTRAAMYLAIAESR
jgi:hypothetical protein